MSLALASGVKGTTSSAPLLLGFFLGSALDSAGVTGAGVPGLDLDPGVVVPSDPRALFFGAAGFLRSYAEKNI